MNTTNQLLVLITQHTNGRATIVTRDDATGRLIAHMASRATAPRLVARHIKNCTNR